MVGTVHPDQSLHDDAQVSWHSIDSALAFQQLESSPIGLDTADVEQRRRQYGENVLPVKTPPGVLQIFIRQFFSPLIYILLGAALISVVIGEFTDAGFITAVVLLNAILGTFQEWRSLPQTPAAVTRTRTSPGPGVVSGTSSTRMSLPP